MLNYNEKLEAQNMAQVPFDTLEYAKILINAGMDRPLAEAQAEAQVRIIASLMQNKLATKDDIREVKDDIKDVKDDIKELGVESEVKLNELDKRLSSKMDEVDKRLSSKIDEVDKRLSGQIAALSMDVHDIKNEIKTLQTKIIVKIGGIVVVALTALSVIMKMCHF